MEREVGGAISAASRLERGTDAVAFTTVLSTAPEAPKAPEDPENVGGPYRTGPMARTLFAWNAGTVRKRTLLRRGQASAVFTAELDNGGLPYKQYISSSAAGDRLIYDRPGETRVYSQGKDQAGATVLKEWVLAREPGKNAPMVWTWRFSGGEGRDVRLVKKADGAVEVRSLIRVSGVSPGDKEKRGSVMEAVSRALKSRARFEDGEILTVLEPPVYWTSGNERKQAEFSVSGEDSLLFSISESSSSYPLLIDPTLNYGQWLGGGGSTIIRALAVVGDEIYAGGYSDSSASWETVTFQGTFSGGDEGFVVEIQDGASPALNWGQWLGGTGIDRVYALAAVGDEIYAAGRSDSSASWETVTFQGAHSGAAEGFVVEIQDGASPALNWGQWLGGTGDDYVFALAAVGDEIYAAGSSTLTVSWETVTFQGAHSGLAEGFVVEIQDGASPALNWGQWLGGAGYDYVYALAAAGDEICAGGYSTSASSWETVTFQGAHSGGAEGFVVEIQDGAPPALNWGQWLGGAGSDYVRALAVSGDEVYAGGDSSSPSSWELTPQGAFGGGSEGFVVEIQDGSSPSLNWGQWLGGLDMEYVKALAVMGDEIYVGGDSASDPPGWEPLQFYGYYFFNPSDGFVVEIRDGTTPVLNWGQWLGGGNIDYLSALVVSGERIFAGGHTYDSADWEPITFQGADTSAIEAFVVKITDDVNTILFLPHF